MQRTSTPSNLSRSASRLASLPMLLALGLVVAPGCANNKKADTENPDGAAEGADGGEQAGTPAGPSRAATASGSTHLTASGARIKSFETPKEVRKDMILSLPTDTGAALSVAEVRPSMAPAGSHVEIFGTGFLEAAGDNKVSSGDSAWEVVGVYGDRLVVVVPEGAPAGAISIAAGVGKGATSNTFQALGGDAAFEQADTSAAGLIGKVYKLDTPAEGEIKFDGLEAVGSIALANLDIASTGASDFDQSLTGYAIRFDGSLNVTQEGEYDLCMNSDDGSRLLLMETLVVDNGGVHEAAEVCELVYLEAGEYDVAIEYQNAASTPNVALSFTWAIDGGEKTAVPASALFRP